jgi:hypothetical protein
MADKDARGSQDLELAEAIEALRTELEKALAESPHHQLRFRLSDVTLTLQTVARKSKEGGLKVGWYVVSAGAGASSEGTSTQTLVLNLTPLVAVEPAVAAGNGDGEIAAALANTGDVDRVPEPVIDLQGLSDEHGGVFAVVKVPGLQASPQPAGTRWASPLFKAIGDYPVVELDPALHSPAITHIKDVMAAQLPGMGEDSAEGL